MRTSMTAAPQRWIRRLFPPLREAWIWLRLNETIPLVSFAAFGLFGWLFVTLAGEVIEGDTQGFDRAILLALRNPADRADPIGPAWLEEVARDVTALGGHSVLGLVTLSVLAYLLLSRRRGAALLVLASVGGGMVLSALMKLGFDRPRPDLVPHYTRVYTASFPSGHAMLSAITYLTLGSLLARIEAERRLKIFFLGLALVVTVLVGLSRVYLGVHWPSDVLGGWCGGAAWAGLCWFVALRLQRRGQVEAPSQSVPVPEPAEGPSG